MANLFRGAASQWGQGKLHTGRYDSRLRRWVAACQKLSPLKGGHDAWDGEYTEGDPSQLTCKRCLTLQEEARWAPMIEAVRREMCRQGRLRDTGYSYSWIAKQAVENWAAAGHEPTSEVSEIARAALADRHYW